MEKTIKINSFRSLFLWIFLMALTGSMITGSCLATELSLITVNELSSDWTSYVIIDARSNNEWKKGHIPGAISFSWENYTTVDEKNIPYRILSPEKLAAVLGFKGISETMQVVVYGDADKSWGGEGWVCWALSWIGHKGRVRLLDGGIQAWKGLNLSVITSGEVKSPLRIYHIDIHNEINISTSELMAANADIQIVDTRSFFERIKGKIPGSVHINWEKFFKGKEPRPVNREEFISLLKKNGIDPEKPIVYYCTGGIRSAYAWTVHQLNGFSNAKNYEGGMEAWSRRKP